MKPCMKGLVLLVLTAALLQPTMAARALTSEDKELVKPPKGDKPDGGKLCTWGIECNGTCKDQFNDTLNCGACNNICPEGAECKKGKCECPKDQEQCDDKCVNKGNCTITPPPEPEPECINNATSFVVTGNDFQQLCFFSTEFCAGASGGPRLAFLCALDPPSFEDLPPAYQAILAADNCFLNETFAFDALPSLEPYCACSFNQDTLPTANALAVLNFLVGVNPTTGEAEAPANLTAPAACADAPFVPFRDLFLCNNPDTSGVNCTAFDEVSNCPSDMPIGMWNTSLGSVGADCRANAINVFDLNQGLSNKTVCLPASNFNCQLQSCPCDAADPVGL